MDWGNLYGNEVSVVPKEIRFACPQGTTLETFDNIPPFSTTNAIADVTQPRWHEQQLYYPSWYQAIIYLEDYIRYYHLANDYRLSEYSFLRHRR